MSSQLKDSPKLTQLQQPAPWFNSAITGIHSLPIELINPILGYLTTLELAIVQQTCKCWYNLAQNTPTLWKNTASFFEKYCNERMPYDDKGVKIDDNNDNRKKFFNGFDEICKLSKGKFDHLYLDFHRFVKCYRYSSLDRQKFAWNKNRIKKVLEIIPSCDCTDIRLLCGLFIDLDLVHLLDSISGCSKLKNLSINGYNRPVKRTNLSWKNLPISGCQLDYLSLGSEIFFSLHEDPGMAQVSKSIKILEIYVNCISSTPEIYLFLAKVNSCLTILSLTGMSRKSLGFFQKVSFEQHEYIDIQLPQLEQLYIAGGFSDKELELFAQIQDDPIKYRLICPKLKTLTVKEPHFPINLISAPALTTVTLTQTYCGSALPFLQQFPNLHTSTFVFHCLDSLADLSLKILPQNITTFHILLVLDWGDNSINTIYHNIASAYHNLESGWSRTIRTCTLQLLRSRLRQVSCFALSREELLSLEYDLRNLRSYKSFLKKNPFVTTRHA